MPAECGVRGLNHLTLAVGDVARSVRFSRDLLGFRLRAEWLEGAYLEAGQLWLCLSYDRVARTEPHRDYTHVALSVADDAFDDLATRITAEARIWKINRSEGRSLYVLDPDGHKLELHEGTLASRLAHYGVKPPAGLVLYD